MHIYCIYIPDRDVSDSGEVILGVYVPVLRCYGAHQYSDQLYGNGEHGPLTYPRL